MSATYDPRLQLHDDGTVSYEWRYDLTDAYDPYVARRRRTLAIRVLNLWPVHVRDQAQAHFSRHGWTFREATKCYVLDPERQAQRARLRLLADDERNPYA